MFLKKYQYIFIFIFYVPFIASICELDKQLKRLLPANKDIRQAEAWIAENAPKTLTFKVGLCQETICLNWAGLMYHIAEPKIKCHAKALNCGLCKIRGFHYDSEGVIQKSGLIDFTTIMQNADQSIYHAKINYKGMTKESTFFPKHWNLRKIAQSIVTAIRNGHVTLVSPSRINVEGKDAQGIRITILLTRTGIITSAYPQI